MPMLRSALNRLLNRENPAMPLTSTTDPIARPWRALSMPKAVTNMRSMLSPEESQYLTWLAAEKFEGWGAIIDLGPWLGSSSAAFAEGLKRSGSNAKIHSLDLFRWEPSYMESIAATGYQEGDDFLPLFKREVGEYGAWIDAQKQDLTNYRWNGGPIEFLFVDAAKSWELTNSIFQGFGHCLVPGRSRVILQDFRFHLTHWLPLIFDSRPDLWQEVESVGDGHTVTFLLLKPLDAPTGIQVEYSERAFPFESAKQILLHRIAREDFHNGALLQRTLYRKCLIDGPPEEAAELREKVLHAGIDGATLSSIEDIESVLIPRAWGLFGQGDFEGSRLLAERCLTIATSKSIYALTLLACSLIRLGERDRTRLLVDEILAKRPEFPSALLLRAELAMADRRHADAEVDIMHVLRENRGEEGDTAWALELISQIWDHHNRDVPSRITGLAELSALLNHSPSFLARLASEQLKDARRSEAMENVEQALRLDPSHKLALKLRDTSIHPSLAPASETTPAGRLHRPVVSTPPTGVQGGALDELVFAVLNHVRLGSFSANDEAVLVGSQMHEALGAALDVHGNRFSRRRYRDYFGAFYEFLGPHRFKIDGATVVELGCGSLNPYGLLFLFILLGARRGIAIDLDPIHDDAGAVRALANLSAMMLINPEDLVGEYPITREQVLNNIASFDLALLRNGNPAGLDRERLGYRQESVHALSLKDGEADVIVSNAFFEHIPRVEYAIEELARVTRRGGIGIHIVDGSDHRRYGANACHPLEFLTETHPEGMVHGSNRVRPLEMGKMFELHGFELVEFEPFETVEISTDLRGRFIEPFKSMPDECLAVPTGKLVVRRR